MWLVSAFSSMYRRYRMWLASTMYRRYGDVASQSDTVGMGMWLASQIQQVWGCDQLVHLVVCTEGIGCGQLVLCTEGMGTWLASQIQQVWGCGQLVRYSRYGDVASQFRYSRYGDVASQSGTEGMGMWLASTFSSIYRYRSCSISSLRMYALLLLFMIFD